MTKINAYLYSVPFIIIDKSMTGLRPDNRLNVVLSDHKALCCYAVIQGAHTLQQLLEK